MFKKVAFTMYLIKDMNHARKFYEEILGLKVSKVSAKRNLSCIPGKMQNVSKSNKLPFADAFNFR